MEVIERIDQFQHFYKFFGSKKFVGSNYFVDFGMKKEIQFSKSSIPVILNNLKEVSCYNTEVLNTPSDFLKEIEFNMKKIESSLYFNELGDLMYLQIDQSFWYSEDSLEEVYTVDKIIRGERVLWQGSLLYTKKQAGFFLNILGNNYFLPRGESFNFYTVGMWDTNFLMSLKNSGLYFESLFMFYGVDKEVWKTINNFEDCLRINNTIGCLLEYSIYSQLMLYISRNVKRQYEGDIICGGLLEILGFYYLFLESYNKNLNRLNSLKNDLKLSNLFLKNFVLEGFSLIDNDIEQVLQNCLHIEKCNKDLYNNSLIEEDLVGSLYLLDIFCILVEVFLDELLQNEVIIEKDSCLDVVVSELALLKKGKFTSVSRREISSS